MAENRSLYELRRRRVCWLRAGVVVAALLVACGGPASPDAGAPSGAIGSADTVGDAAEPDSSVPDSSQIDAGAPPADAPHDGLTDVPTTPQPLLVVDFTPAEGGSGTGGGVTVEVPPGAFPEAVALVVYEGPAGGAVAGLSPELDPVTIPVAALRFEPNGIELLAAATVTVVVPGSVGSTPGGRAAILMRAPGGTWTLAEGPLGPTIGEVVPGPAVRYPLLTLATYAVALVPEPLAACVGTDAVSCADGDDDGVPDVTDVCPGAKDPGQADGDQDGVGDACDLCPGVADPDQADGDGNGRGDACDACWTSSGPPACDDGKPCNGVESCDPVTGCVPGEPPLGCCTSAADCDDGDVCNGAEWCDGDSTCQQGTQLECDDGNACNGAETCVPATGCVAGAAPLCSDGNLCNGIEKCDAIEGCVSSPPPSCADSNACTLEQCDPSIGCVTTLVVCDDGDLCNGVESCDPAIGCVAGSPPACHDGKPCNGLEVCDPDVGCVNGGPPGGCCTSKSDCDDGNPCNGTGVCDTDTGTCVLAPPLACNDGNACNGAESCVPQLGCVAGAPPACDDSNVCNGAESCHPQLGCVQGTPLACASTNLCTGVATCDPSLGCVLAPPVACNDGNVCNGVEYCDPVAGCVGGVPLLCDDGMPCNGQETCDPVTGCAPGAAPPGCCTDGAPCDDQNPCNGQWTCETGTGTCELVVAPTSCVSGNACVGIGYCDPSGGCQITSKLDCTDDNVCNGVESCSPDRGCVPGPLPDCNDGFACTDDACDPTLGCSHVASAACSLVVPVTPEAGGAGKAAETELALMVPGGAVTEPVTIVVEAAPSLDGAQSESAEVVWSAHTFAPDGLTFEVPVHVTLPAPPGALSGDTLVVLVRDEAEGSWAHAVHTDGTPITAQVGGDPLTVSFTLDHFSDYGVAQPCEACCVVDSDCDDGLPCTHDECGGAKGCVFEDDSTLCDDGDPCTEDSCVAGQCGHAPGNGAPCDDGDPCTLGDTCAVGACQGAPKECSAEEGSCAPEACVAGECVATPDDDLCDDGDPCTDDTCAAGGCVHAPATGPPCDDGDPCTTGDACAEGSCGGEPVQCDGGPGSCLVGACVEGACDYTPDDTLCDDGNPCTADTCAGAGHCGHTAQSGACDDGDPCTAPDACAGGECGGPAIDCDDGDPCTTDACDGACSSTPLPCDDGVPCTTDSCAFGDCAHTPSDAACDDADPCTDDACDAATGCESTLNDLCDDGNVCTIDICDQGGSCSTIPAASGSCDDGDPCTEGDACGLHGACQGTPLPCDDGDACTEDGCAAGACTHGAAESAPCDDDDACTSNDGCAGGVCAGDPVGCSDGTPCTLDACDPATGCTHTPIEGIGCSDGDLCTTADSCSGGVCSGKVKCDDGDACTADACDPADGACSAPPVDCNDEDDCTADACDPATGCTHTIEPQCVDTDGDGTPDVVDCAPWDATVHPAAAETCDQRDEDCDGSVDEGACGQGDPCVQTDQCTTPICLESSPGGQRYCVSTGDACLHPLADGTAEVTPSGSLGCATGTATATCQGGGWGPPVACGVDLPWCAQGACAECAPGTRGCAGDVSIVCNAAGTFEAVTTCLAPLACFGQGSCAMTGELTVHQTTNAVHSDSDVAVRRDDSFMVIWGQGGVLHGRWFAPTGQPHPERPDQLTIGSVSGTGQDPNHAAVRPDGLVAAVAHNGNGVWVRTLGPTVTVDGPTTIVDPSSVKGETAIAALDNGSFAVAWKTNSSYQTAVVNPSTGSVSSKEWVSSYTGNEVNYWPLTVAKTGSGYAVLWAAYKPIPTAFVFMRRYSELGAPLGEPKALTTGTGTNDSQPYCVSSGADKMRCVWAALGIATAELDGLGEMVSPLVKASSGGALPRLGISPAGRFVVGWWSGASDTYARVYEADGTPTAAAVLLEKKSTANTLFPRCGAFNDNRFVCIWTDIVSGGSNVAVRMRMVD